MICACLRQEGGSDQVGREEGQEEEVFKESARCFDTRISQVERQRVGIFIVVDIIFAILGLLVVSEPVYKPECACLF